jgi:hypothetical protein
MAIGKEAMRYHDFRQRIIDTLPVGTALPNPGGGNSIIVSYTEHNIAYQRRNSKIYVAFKDLYDAYNTFRGGILDSTTLRGHNPQVFDSKRSGHSCNCTFLFMVLKATGVVDRIEGAGKRSDPFWVMIPENTDW